MKQLPSQHEIARIRREAKSNRAVEAYKFFYPLVSMQLNFEVLEELGAAANRGFVVQLTTPDLVTLTQNSDTPYGLGYVDASDGPVVVELPAGPIMGVADDQYFQFVTNMGILGEEEGRGAKYLFVGPDFDGDLPDGYLVQRMHTNRALICARAPLPDAEAGKALLRTIRVYRLSDAGNPPETTFRDVSNEKVVANPCTVDGTFEFWEVVKRALDADVPSASYYNALGMLVDLGLRSGHPFEPDAELRAVLSEAAKTADEQLVVAAFASDDPQRMVWPDRRWEWVAFSEGDNGYYEQHYLHLAVRERWFYQATLETPAMFRHAEGAGSLYWLANVDADGAQLDGGTSYTLTIPTPVPATQFWSVTLYDLDTRSEIATPQFKPVLTSLRDRLVPDDAGNLTLHFGPDRPTEDVPWLQTNRGSSWFAYFRIYGPQSAAFDGSWKPSDFRRA